MTTAEKTEELCRRIQYDSDLAAIMDFFFDHVGSEPAFIESARPFSGSHIRDEIELIAKHLFGKPNPTVTAFDLFSVPGYGFVHGSCTVERCLSIVVYLPDFRVGVIAIHRGATPNETVFARFSPADLSKIPARSAAVN